MAGATETGPLLKALPGPKERALPRRALCLRTYERTERFNRRVYAGKMLEVLPDTLGSRVVHSIAPAHLIDEPRRDEDRRHREERA